MARSAVARRLSAGVLALDGFTFALATAADEAEIRRLLRENPLGGGIEITLEREPNAFAADFGLSRNHAVILAREASGRVIGMCERVVGEAFVNGEARLLPYLGGLRIAASHRHRVAILRGGFQALRALAERPGEEPFALTSITADNTAARRLLTAGVPGLPRYQPVGAFSTFGVRPRRARTAEGIEPAGEADFPAVADFLQRQLGRFQFAPVWSVEKLRGLGLDILLARHRGELRGCLALWDQGAVKQAVVRRYPPLLGLARPVVNLLAGLPRLPAPGTALRQADISHVAVEGDDAEIFLALLEAALDLSAQRGFGAAAVGLASAHPWRAALKRRYRTLEYRTELYLAHWPEAGDMVAAVERQLPFPELGLL